MPSTGTVHQGRRRRCGHGLRRVGVSSYHVEVRDARSALEARAARILCACVAGQPGRLAWVCVQNGTSAVLVITQHYS